MSAELRDEMLRTYWALAIARKLLSTARADRRFDDANYYAKNVEVEERGARELLAQEAAS